SDPVSYYLVSYGTSAGGQTYGNPNVGGKGTTSYTISGLSGRGATYYFKVRAGNGCEPGDYSNEISASPTGVFIAGPAAGFAEGVLGVATKEANIKEEKNKQEVLGTKTQDQKKQNSIKIWLSLLFLLLILIYIKNNLSNK
ncbi:MAG: fibronectin type III domain-containing protein, partial [bacterium]